MPRGFHVDIQASVERFGTAGLRAGRWRQGFSFVSQPKQIGEHGGAHLILVRDDPDYAGQIGIARQEIFRRNQKMYWGEFHCWKCGMLVAESPNEYRTYGCPVGEWDHIENAPGSGATARRMAE